MKWFHIVLTLLFMYSIATAQTEGHFPGEALSPNSPFEHLLGGLQKSNSVPRTFCPTFLYYQNGPNPTYAYYLDSLPVSTEWAIKLTLPTNQQASVCTVWTQMIDFELLGATLFSKDTMRFYVRNATPPYAILYSTYFIARSGLNQGSVELDPPLVPPFVTPEIRPLRDILLGYKVLGDSGHAVKWKFTTPSLYTTAPRSFKVTPAGLIPASNVVGQSVDWVNEARLCCDKWIPVELSAFTAHVDANAVYLRWRTETETNNFHFMLQRATSPEGPWDTRSVLPGHGTTTLPQDYAFRDSYSLVDFAGQAPVVWYRLRQQDFDGVINDHPPIQVHLADLASLGFELGPIYPNPVIASSAQLGRIRYRVPEERHVRISVHDMLGREITVLTSAIHPAGVYESAWAPITDQGILNSGTYIVRLLSGGISMVRSISVVR